MPLPWTRRTPLALFLVSLTLACSKEAAPTTTPAETPLEPERTTRAPGATAPGGLVTSGSRAVLGELAPDFSLPDLAGNKTILSVHRGKTVVLEWFNPECPFVRRSHTVGSLVDTAARHTKNGVVWLAINSGAPGRQGHGLEANQQGVATFRLEHPVLLDESGEVGKAYDAAHTPHMFVIDGKGRLVYRGAIDNSPDGEGQSPEGGRLVNYVDAALADLAQGREVATKQTQAYGCSVKYASQ